MWACHKTHHNHSHHTNHQHHQAPIVVVGPVVGSSGALVRISQVILGTVLYVVTDNLFFPVVRAVSRLCPLTALPLSRDSLRGSDSDGFPTDNSKDIK